RCGRGGVRPGSSNSGSVLRRPNRESPPVSSSSICGPSGCTTSARGWSTHRPRYGTRSTRGGRCRVGRDCRSSRTSSTRADCWPRAAASAGSDSFHQLNGAFVLEDDLLGARTQQQYADGRAALGGVDDEQGRMLCREVEYLRGEIGSDALDLVLEPRLGEGGTQAGALGQGRRRRGGGRVRVEHDRAQTRVLTSEIGRAHV